MGKNNIRSEYVKDLLTEKDNLGAMLSESTSEAIKSFLGESVNKGLRNILSEADDSFTEEEVDDKAPEFKKNSKKDKKEKSDKDSKKKSSKKSEPKDDDDEDFDIEDKDGFDNENGFEDDTDDFDDEGDDLNDEDNEDFDDEGDDLNDEDNEDFDDEGNDLNDEDGDDFDADNDFDGNMESGEDDFEDPDDEIWDSMEEFKGEDGEYDLTGQDKDTVMKILKAMKPEDGVRVVKNDDDTYTVNDEENETEYVVELDEDEFIDGNDVEENGFDDVPNDEFDDDFNTEDFDDESDLDFGTGDEFDDVDSFEDDEFSDYPMAAECGMGECGLNETNLGYTDSYQKNTAMTMDSDDDSDNGSPIKMNAGLPRGSKNNGKRWVGNTSGKMAPYTSKTKSETLYEVELDEEGETDTTFNSGSSTSGQVPSTSEASTVAHGAHTKGLNGVSPKNRKDNGRAPHKSPMSSNENFERKIKAIMAENKELKKIANEIKRRLKENVVVNASLGKIIKLMVENSTTRDEKVNILNRFNKVKSVNESKELYETISNELKGSKKGGSKPSISSQLTEAKKTNQQIVESRLNESQDVKDMKDLITRLDKIK